MGTTELPVEPDPAPPTCDGLWADNIQRLVNQMDRDFHALAQSFASFKQEANCKIEDLQNRVALLEGGGPK